MFVPVCVCCVRRVARRTWAAGWESFWQKPVPLLTPSPFIMTMQMWKLLPTSVQLPVTLSCELRVKEMRAYIRSSWWFWPPCFFSCLFRWATSTDSRTYDEVPFEAIEVCGRRWTNIWSSAYTLTQWFAAFSQRTLFTSHMLPSKRNLFTKKHLILCAQT